MDILTRDFYSRDTLAVARDLLGRDIVRVLEDGTALRCRITETEAYIGRARPATPTAINAPLGPRPCSPRRGRPTST